MTKQFHGNTLSHEALEQLFFEARSYNGWLDKDVSEDQIRRIYDLLKMGPTSANQQSARFVWCRSDEAKEKLASHAMEANKKKIKTAPWCVIIGYDIDFHEELPWLFPHTDAKSWFEGDVEGRITQAKRNSALQGAYLMLAARALGLDCGPMRYCIANGYDQAFAKFSPGRVLLYADFEAAYERGIERIDWGLGDAGYKEGMGARPDAEMIDVLLVRPAILAALLSPLWMRG